MNKLLALLTVGAIAGTAVADVPPPPPPKGKKYVSVSNEVILSKHVTGYVFIQQTGTFPGAPRFTYSKLELTSEKAVAIAAGGGRTFETLIVVPQDTAKEFKTDADLFAALGADKVKGTHTLRFVGRATVSDTVKGDSVKWTYTITAIDPKDGIKSKVEGEGAELTAEKPEKKEKAPPSGVSWMAGGAAALAALLGGFWLAGRARRKA